MVKASKKRKRTFFYGLIFGVGLASIPIQKEFSTTPLFQSTLPTTAPLLKKECYSLAYDGRTRQPHWVYHHLTKETLAFHGNRKECHFAEENALPKHIRSTDKDFARSGYDRGHLCPAADAPSQPALQETFLFSNISPQTPAFNRGYWKKLEAHIRDLADTHKSVHVFSGPLFSSHEGAGGKRFVTYEVIGSSEVAVPTHFYSLLFIEESSGKVKTAAYILPNEAIDHKTKLKKFAVSIEELESRSGVLFTHLGQLQ